MESQQKAYNTGCPLSFETGGTMPLNGVQLLFFSLTLYPCIYTFGGIGPILGVKNPLQRVNGHADNIMHKGRFNKVYIEKTGAGRDDTEHKTVIHIK
jgi:hypothetical protein